MRILVIGSGGREHCIVWKLRQDCPENEIFCVPGNTGISQIAKCDSVSLKPTFKSSTGILPVIRKQDACATIDQDACATLAHKQDACGTFDDIIKYVRDNKIDLTIVGPEIPLVDGIVDCFEELGMPIFGPNKAASQMEGSKHFAKEIMKSAGVPTALSETFSDFNSAVKYLDTVNAPYVIKADGLAAGKGVSIFKDKQEAIENLKQVMEQRVFGSAGSQVVIEEFLEGEEASILAFTDGKTILQMASAQDHKPIGDGDTGPNTGGMGSYSPAPVVTPQLSSEVFEKVLKPTIAELNKRGIKYKGVLYAGLMITKDGPKVIEFNCRFGDPETQVILPRLKNNLADVCMAVAEERLSEVSLQWRDECAVCVIASSKGYPGDYEKGFEITGLDNIDEKEGVVFHAGTSFKDGKIVTNGGRVLGLTTLGKDIKSTIEKNYELMKKINYDGIYYRSDIGKKAISRREKETQR